MRSKPSCRKWRDCDQARPFSTSGEGGKTAFIPAYVFELCRKFRKEPTSAEKLLWQCLRNRQLYGLKFRRQHPLGRYIADFYCAEARLVVELEGRVHGKIKQQEYDQIRKGELETRGLQVLRFDYEAALKRTEEVLAKIVAVATSSATPPTCLKTPLPRPLSTGWRGEKDTRKKALFPLSI